MLALRVMPVEEDAKQHERWRPWHVRDADRTKRQSQPAGHRPEDRLSLRLQKPGSYSARIHRVLRRLASGFR